MPPTQQVHHPHPASNVPVRGKHVDLATRTVRLELFIILVGSALILAVLSAWLAFGTNVKTEADHVAASKYQAVFLNGVSSTTGYANGSLYFGHITKLTGSYIILNNVYYLSAQSTASSSSSSPQLVKLGCQQLHAPYDEMVINRTQVAFWENLQDSGKVVQAIQSYVKANPKGPDCSQSSSSNSSSSAATTPSSTTPSSSTNSTAANAAP